MSASPRGESKWRFEGTTQRTHETFAQCLAIDRNLSPAARPRNKPRIVILQSDAYRVQCPKGSSLACVFRSIRQSLSYGKFSWYVVRRLSRNIVDRTVEDASGRNIKLYPNRLPNPHKLNF
jgi:hypothetical protein